MDDTPAQPPAPPPKAPGRGASSVRTPVPQQDGPSDDVPIGRSPPWSDDETLFLIAERGAREYKREAGPSLRKLRETKKQRDEGLAKCLNDKGFGPRTGAQVNNRWDVIRTGYTKMNDWNKRSGQQSYWEMSSADKKKLAKGGKMPVYYR